MKRLVCMASLCLGVCASGAYAADVSVWGSLGQMLEASDNYFLQNTPLGTTFKSLSTVNLDVLARTPGMAIPVVFECQLLQLFRCWCRRDKSDQRHAHQRDVPRRSRDGFRQVFCGRDLHSRRCCRDPVEGKRHHHRETARSTRSGPSAARPMISTGLIRCRGPSRQTGRRSTMPRGKRLSPTSGRPSPGTVCSIPARPGRTQ